MKCLEAQRLIHPFLRRKLTDEQLKAFVEHIDHCPGCREELEINLAVYSTLDQSDGTGEREMLLTGHNGRRLSRIRERYAFLLDQYEGGDVVFSVDEYDFTKKMNERMGEAKNYLREKRFYRLRNAALLAGSAILLSLFLIARAAGWLDALDDIAMVDQTPEREDVEMLSENETQDNFDKGEP